MIKQFGWKEKTQGGVIGPIEAGKMEKGLMDALKSRKEISSGQFK